jgi:nitrous oxide reductase
MNKPPLLLPVTLLAVSALCVSIARAADPAAPAAAAATDQEAAYLADVTKRAEKHIAALKLDDPAKATQVRDIIVNQYRSLRTAHDARDAKLKELPKGDASKPQADAIKAETDASLKPLHEAFIKDLSAQLTPEQVEKVKDEMTYNVVNVTYKAFQDMIPQLTEPQKAYILAQLKEARELAMDQGSSKEKHAVFGKYKGRINNYLAKQGYDLKQANKEWAERRKAREASEKQQPPKQD